MIVISISKGVFYRMNTPKWAYMPTSGAGAASQGGRLNRPGIEALYLSAEAPTALAEYQQTSPFLPPGTMVSYTVSAAKVVDFSGGYAATAWAPLWQDFDCDWRKLVFKDKIEPPTWVLYDMVVAAGCQGVLFPSVASPGGKNLVVYNAMLGATDLLDAIDPTGQLPKNQSSWK
jgi:RES domain-containing protein